MDNKSNKQKVKQLTKDKEKAINCFINEITLLVNAIYDKNKRDNDIIEIRDGYMLAKNENPECIIIHSGPYFWKYREEIDSGNLDKLLNNEFKDEIIDWQEKLSNDPQGSLPEKSSLDRLQGLVGKMKKTWHLFTPAEQKVLKTKLKMIVAHYATYVGICKQIKKQ